MTYTFKLSRRLARLRDATVIATSLFTLSCSDGPSGPGSTPLGTDPTSVVIAPDSISVGANQTVQFEAVTDTSSALSFNHASSKGRGRRKVVSVALSPVSSSVVRGGSQSFNATATLSDGSTVQPSLVWAATGGTVDSSGKYTAGKATGKYRVIATASNGVADTAAVSITTIAPILAQIVLSPASTSLPAGGSQQFTVEGKSADSATVSVTPTYTATGGTISPAGVYTAGQTPGTFRVIATDSETDVADTSEVTITALGATLQSVVLIPAAASVAQGAKQPFSASGQMSDGSTVPLSPSFTATGGTISSSGEYTAGNTAGTYRVIATDQASANADTSLVTITAPPATLQAVVLTPTTISLTAGATKQFAASGTMSDGSTSAVTVVWSASGGTISSAGLYTAGNTAGTYRVIATDQASANADTSSVMITASPATLQAVVLTPSTISLTTGATKQFVASGTMSDGSTSAVTVVWSASGGTISSAGLYTAGPTTGTFRVFATDTTTNLADTSAVIIEAPPAVLQAVVVSPATVSLTTGATQQFAATGKMSDGSTSVVKVGWTASGGTISSAGLYNAGETAGTYRVIATQSGGTLADTASVTITAPTPTPPGPVSGTTFFVADAESGAVTPPWDGPVFGNNGLVPVTSTTRAKNGGRSFKFEVPPTSVISSSTVMALRPQVSMGGPSGHFKSGYYSFWAYVDAGFNNTAWNMILGWMTGVSGAPSPISYIGLENWQSNGVSRGGTNLQVVFLLKNCGAGTYACPTIPGYANSGGEWYRQTSSSPNGVTPFPRQQWVHLSVYYKMAATNGQVTIWQDGVKIMDLTVPTMNTFGGHSVDPLTNAAGDMVLQHFIYGGAENTTRRMYVDDFKVTDFRVVP